MLLNIYRIYIWVFGWLTRRGELHVLEQIDGVISVFFVFSILILGIRKVLFRYLDKPRWKLLLKLL